MSHMYATVGRAWRATRRSATRSWYGEPVTLLVVYALLAVAAVAVSGRVRPIFDQAGYYPLPVLAFACWRVARGGAFSRGVLIYVTVQALLMTATQFAQWWAIEAVAMFAISVAGLLLLLSPAVYARTHPGATPASTRIRLRPGILMSLAAPFAGITVAAVTLAVPRRWALPGRGCMSAPVEVLPRRCVGFGRGFPLPVVATAHGHHVVSTFAFVKDCAQWSLVIFVVSYLIWLALHRRQEPVAGRPADPDLAVQPSQ